MYIIISIKTFHHSVHYELHTCFCLPIALMVLWWWFGLMDFQAPAEFPELRETKFVPASAFRYLSLKFIFCKYNFTCFDETINTESICLLHNWELAVVIYITEVCFIIQHKCVCTYSLPQLAWHVMKYLFGFWLCGLKFQGMLSNFNGIFNIIINIDQYMDSHASNLLSSTPIRLILLNFINISSITDMSHSCTCSFTSVLNDGHPFITYTVSALGWSSAWAAHLISSAIMYSGVSMHISITLMFRFIPVNSFLHLCLHYGCAWIISHPCL